MPARLQRNQRGGTKGPLADAPNFDYEYPGDLELDPRSEFHRKLLEAILYRVQDSHDSMCARYPKWRKLDETLTSYIRVEKDKDEGQRDNVKKRDKPLVIVTPMSAWILDTMMTYLVSTFLTTPIFRYEGGGPEDETGAMLLEGIVDKQAQKGQIGMEISTMIRSSLVYGLGAATPVWTVTEGYRDFADTEGAVDRETGRRIRQREVTYEGNELFAINPYRYFPDTSVADWKVKDMEYVGWMQTENITSILDEERSMHGDTFNARYLHYVDGFSVFNQDDTSLNPDGPDPQRRRGTGNVMDRIYVYWNLIPADWDLGPSEYPEKWLFSIAGDQVILEAHPVEFNHDMFPVVVAAPRSDGFSAANVSDMELIHGLQKYGDFLVNSRIANLMMTVNGRDVLNPSKIDMPSYQFGGMNDPILLAKGEWQTPVKDVIEQLSFPDVTSDNLVEALGVSQLAEQGVGATEPIQGRFAGGERKTAEEVRLVGNAALSRLEKAARLISIQAVRPLGYLIASQTQQFLSESQWVRFVGRHEEDLKAIFEGEKGRQVDARDIRVAYDVAVSDGSLPDRGDANLMFQVVQLAAQSPELFQEFEIGRLLRYSLRSAGFTNVEDFVKPGANVSRQVLPDEVVQEQAASGSVTPLSAIGGL